MTHRKSGIFQTEDTGDEVFAIISGTESTVRVYSVTKNKVVGDYSRLGLRNKNPFRELEPHHKYRQNVKEATGKFFEPMHVIDGRVYAVAEDNEVCIAKVDGEDNVLSTEIVDLKVFGKPEMMVI